MYCNQCGHRNPLGSNFCSSCGAPLASGGDDTTITFVPLGGEGGEEDVAVQIPQLGESFGLLVVKRGPNAGSKFLLDQDVTRVGRHPESDIFLDDITVSRRHAEFAQRGDAYVVRDVGSLNGTYVNRERIDEVALSNGDEVQIGKFKLVYMAATPEA